MLDEIERDGLELFRINMVSFSTLCFDSPGWGEVRIEGCPLEEEAKDRAIRFAVRKTIVISVSASPEEVRIKEIGQKGGIG